MMSNFERIVTIKNIREIKGWEEVYYVSFYETGIIGFIPKDRMVGLKQGDKIIHSCKDGKTEVVKLNE